MKACLRHSLQAFSLPGQRRVVDHAVGDPRAGRQDHVVRPVDLSVQRARNAIATNSSRRHGNYWQLNFDGFHTRRRLYLQCGKFWSLWNEKRRRREQVAPRLW